MASVALPFYERTYRGFHKEARAQVRRETYESDLGQTSWVDLDELRTFANWLGCGPGDVVLDVACGSGGPAMQLIRDTGAAVVGIDANEDAIANASTASRSAAMRAVSRFYRADAAARLSFPDESFDAVVCIDAIHYFPDRAAVLEDWRRILVPGGTILYSDPAVVTGVVAREELDERSAIGTFTFTPPGENERLLAAAGFEIERRADATGSVETVAERWHDARERHADALERDEGREAFAAAQRFLRTTARLARERRLSRHVFVARRVR